MLNPIRVMVLLVCLLAGWTASAWADPSHGHGRGKHHHGPAEYKSRGGQHKTLNMDEVFQALLGAGISQTYVRSLAMDQDLMGYRSLPPGIQMKLARGKPLPRGLARQAIPASLRVKLPRYAGYEWLVVGTHLVLMGMASENVAEVFRDTFQ